MPGGTPIFGGGCFPILGNADFFLPSRQNGEVMPMYLTIEQLFLIAGFILALLTYIDHKKK